jgi:hypothetical protein
MKRKLRIMFLVTELNLLLWLAIFGMAASNIDDQEQASWWTATAEIQISLVLVGVVFAAVVQHWAYYALYKEATRKREGGMDHQ